MSARLAPTVAAQPAAPPVAMDAAALGDPRYRAPEADYAGTLDYYKRIKGLLATNIKKVEGISGLKSEVDPEAQLYADVQRLRDVGHLEDFREIQTTPFKDILTSVDAQPGTYSREIMEFAGIHAYSREVYTQFQNALEDNDFSALTAMQARLLRLAVAGLRRMTKYQGFVYSGYYLNLASPRDRRQREIKQRYEKGTVERVPKFMSTSKRVGTSYIAKDGRDYAQVLKTKNGVDITLLAANPDTEREVLVPPGAQLESMGYDDRLLPVAQNQPPKRPSGFPNHPDTPDQVWVYFEEK
jgi:hypothetical protein